MGTLKDHGIAFKVAAAVVAAVFSFEQVAFAGEFIESTIQRLNDSQTRLFAPGYLQSQQDAQTGLVDQKQAIEDSMSAQALVTSASVTPPAQESLDLKGPIGGGSQSTSQAAPLSDITQPSGGNVSLTTQAGDVIYYVDGAISRIVQYDGTILNNIAVDQDNNLLGSDIAYTDGTTQVVENGKLVRAVRPDGTVINYNAKERIGSVAYPSGAAVTYTYIEDVSGNITETVLTNSNGTISHYDTNDKLSKIIKPDGIVTEFTGGILSKITKPNGEVFQFKSEIVTIVVELPPPEPTAEELAIHAQILEIQSLFYTNPAEFARRTKELHDLIELTSSPYQDNGPVKVVTPTGEVKVTLSKYIDEAGNTYNYSDGIVVSIKVRYGGVLYEGSVNTNGYFNTGMLTFQDGTIASISQGVVLSAKLSDGSTVNYSYPAPGVIFADLWKNGQLTHYEFNGDNQLVRDLTGITYKFVKGLITQKVAANGNVTNYLREYDLLSNVSRITIQGTAYVYNKDTGIFAKESSGIRNMSYFSTWCGQTTVSGISANIILTDGTYLYIQKYDKTLRADVFIKIGTGLKGTISGKNYGMIASSYSSPSAVYYSDGFIYQSTPDPSILEKINVNTGARTQITVPSGLIDFRNSKPGVKALMTSDGKYVYNAVNYVGNGMFNGWTVKVFDPNNNWQLVKTYAAGSISYATSGIMSDGIFLYFVDQGNGRITASRLSDGVITATYNKPRALSGQMSCQYDWVNNRIWFGSGLTTSVFYYTSLITPITPGSIDTDGFFTPTAKLTKITNITNCSSNIALPSNGFLNSAAGYKKLIYGADSTLVSVLRYDGTVFAFTNGTVSSVTDAGGNAVTYSYDYSDFNTVLDVSVARDGIKRFYDIKGSLKSIVTTDNTTITYDGNNISSIAYADGTKLIYSGGRVDEAVDKDGTQFTIDASGRPTQAVDRYGNVYNYTYSIDALTGKNITLIEDISKSETRRYEDGLLMRTEGSDGTVSSNIYYQDGRLMTVMITRLGRTLNVYNYIYNTDGTISVSDNDGNTRIYGADGKLFMLTDAVGNVYQYTYPDSVATIMEMTQYNGPQSDDLVVRQDFINNKVNKIYKADGTVTCYTFDGKTDYIADFGGKILVDYQYNDAGELIAIIMAGARRDLAFSVEDAENRIAEERVAALATLAAQRGIVVGQIDNQVAPDLNSLVSQRSSLQSQWNSLNSQNVGWDPFGTKRKEKSRALDQLGQALAQVNAALSQIYAQLAEAYAQVDSEVAALKTRIDSQAEASLSQVKAQEDELAFNISKQEAGAFILYYYRTVLGRDPDPAEVDSWLAKLSPDHQKIDRSEILESILASTEYNILRENVAKIKQDVRTLVALYLSKTTPEDKAAFLSQFGLTAQDAVELTAADAEKILQWIDSQGLHFGQSAFYALENIMAANGVNCGIEDLAVATIFIDIATGATDIFTQGDLTLSMRALSKFAGTKGVTLYNTKLTFDDLLALQAPGSGIQAIAHIDGNHYITITGIDGDEVHYREENKGASGTSEIMSKSDFLKKWSGYTITKAAPQDNSKIISASEAKKVKGAFFAFLIPLIGAIVGAVSGIITGIVTAVTAIVSGVIGVVSAALANVAGFIATAGAQLVSGIGAAFSGIGQMVGTLLGSSFLGTAINTVVGVGLSFGIQTGLQAMGVNSTIASLTSAFLTGGVLGLINPLKGVGMLGSFMSGALKYATVAGINELAPRLNLDPSISGILSITAGALVDGLWQGDIGGKFIKIAPNIAGEFAYYGVSKLGTELGIDPSISYLAGVGIRSAINIGLAPGQKAADIWNGINSGLLNGATSIGFQWATQALGINPLISALSAGAIMGGLEALLEGRNPVEGVFEEYFKAGTGLLTLGGDGGNDPWLRAAYISQVLDFSNIIREQGIVAALENYSAGFLNQTTINEIWKQGGIADLLMNDAETVINGEGQAVKRVWVNSGDKANSAYIDLDLSTDNIRGYKQIFSDGGYEIADCDYVVGPDGKIQAKNEIRTKYDAECNPVLRAVTELFNLVKIEVFNKGTLVSEIIPARGKSGIELDSNGNPLSATVIDTVNYRLYSFGDSELNYYAVLNSNATGTLADIDFSDPDNVNVLLNNLHFSIGDINKLNLTIQDKQQILTILLFNGIGNKEPISMSPSYMYGFLDQLAQISPGAVNTIFIASYENSAGLFGRGSNVISWICDTYFNSNEVSNHIAYEIYLKFSDNPPTNMVGFAYSGTGNPLLQMLNENPSIDMKSVVLAGAPLKYGMQITNPSVKNVISIEGGADLVVSLFGGYFWSLEESPNPLNLYRIVLKGVDHFSYMYDPNNRKHDLKTEQAARFAMYIATIANDQISFERFLRITSGITYNSNSKIYEVDLGEVTYEE